MNSYQKNPLKLYIQDIFRAKRTENNRYIYEIFDLTFKNIMIHGIVTCIYNNTKYTTNLEITDATSSVQVYFDCRKNNYKIEDSEMKNVANSFQSVLYNNDDNIDILQTLYDAIVSKNLNPITFKEGDYVAVVGDIFLDDITETRMISAYEINVTSVDREIIWLEELQYLYNKFYL